MKARSSHTKNKQENHFFPQQVVSDLISQKQNKIKTQINTPANELAFQSQIHKVANKSGLQQYKIVRTQKPDGPFTVIQKKEPLDHRNQLQPDGRRNHLGLHGQNITSAQLNGSMNPNFFPQGDHLRSAEKLKESQMRGNILEDSHGD